MLPPILMNDEQSLRCSFSFQPGESAAQGATAEVHTTGQCPGDLHP